MKRATLAATGAVAAIACAAIAQASVVEYTLHGDTTEASLGDTIRITVDAVIDPQGAPFHALALSVFNIVNDDFTGGGTMDFTSPTLGLAPEFAPTGSPGTLIDNDIIGVQAAQLPGFINPAVNTDTNLTIYTFEYSIDDATPRDVTFDLSGLMTQVYAGSGPGGSAIITSSSNPFTVSVNTVPAPGAAALLGLAGICGRGRRRRKN